MIAYDSRAHGDSSGDACTYGFFEKEDLRRVLDAVGPGPWDEIVRWIDDALRSTAHQVERGG